MKRVTKVEPLDGYKLLLEFDNGEKRTADVAALLNKPAFSFLRDEARFRTVYIEYGAVTWKNDSGDEVDICPDKLYMDSKAI